MELLALLLKSCVIRKNEEAMVIPCKEKGWYRNWPNLLWRYGLSMEIWPYGVSPEQAKNLPDRIVGHAPPMVMVAEILDT